MNLDHVTWGFRYKNLCGESFGIKTYIGIYNGTREARRPKELFHSGR